VRNVYIISVRKRNGNVLVSETLAQIVGEASQPRVREYHRALFMSDSALRRL
jgi:hypothetical protein